MLHMRIVIFGLTISSSWGNGHATLWRGLCNALAASGHSVTFFEKDVPYYRNHRDLCKADAFDLQLYPKWDDIQFQVRDKVANCDCAVITSYCPDSRTASDLVLEFPNICRVFYDLDTPVTLNVLGQHG